MKKSTADTVKSVIVLFAITLVCVALLALANEFLKYTPTLNADMASNLYSICPTGEETDDNALEYFEILDNEKELKEINKTLGKTYKGKVLAVYRAIAGVNEGAYIIQASSTGRDGDIIMLTAFDGENKILGVTCYSQAESYWARIDTEKFNNLIGKTGKVESTDIDTGTGATLSLSAVARAVTLSYYTVENLSGGNA